MKRLLFVLDARAGLVVEGSVEGSAVVEGSEGSAARVSAALLGLSAAGRELVRPGKLFAGIA